MNLSASLPKRAENFAQPVCGTSEICTTTVVADREPASDREALHVEAHVDEQVVAGKRPALRLGDELEQARRRDRELVLPAHGPVLVDVGGRAPAIADEAVLERELGRLRQLALALRGPDDDELERALLARQRAQRRQVRIEALAWHVEVGAHGRRC